MAPEALIVVAGVIVGVLYGIFGVGAAFATPVLAVLGVPGIAAVVAPLPGLLPGSASSAWTYARAGKVDRPVAVRTLAGALPAAIAGAVASRWVSGPVLVALSGAVLLAVGIRVLRPTPETAGEPWARRRPSLLVASATVVGFASGLLANGGGFLLVPLFLLAVGLDMNTATGTSLVVATALTVPTLVTHAMLGHIDWSVAGLFALGLVPGAVAGARVSPRLPAEQLRRVFGWLLVVFALWFMVRQIPQLVS